MGVLGDKNVRWPGIEPGSNAWKASMLTITPPTLISICKVFIDKLKRNNRQKVRPFFDLASTFMNRFLTH